jgi:hypothetical protein
MYECFVFGLIRLMPALGSHCSESRCSTVTDAVISTTISANVQNDLVHKNVILWEPLEAS